MASANTTKPVVKLSDLSVRKLKRGGRLTDSHYPGLNVNKTDKGRTSFFYRYRSPYPKVENGKSDYFPMRQYKIGYYPEMSLSEARTEYEKLKAVRDSGVCPVEQKKAAKYIKAEELVRKRELEEQELFTVEKCVEHYLTGWIEVNRKKKSASEVRRILYNDPVKQLGALPVTSISSAQIILLVMDVVNRGANVVAGQMLRELTVAFEFAVGDLLPEDFINPCLTAKARLKQKKIRLTSKRGERWLNDGELAELLRWLPGSKYTSAQKGVLQLTLLTGCRTGEVCAAMWKDINLEVGVWHLRETKTGVARNVQLSRQAVVFLKQLKKTTGECLFPSQKTGMPIQQKQLSEQAWRLRQVGAFLALSSPWTPHDLRRSVRTGLARLKCPNEVAEAVLGHTKNGMEGVYNLHNYESECGEWLQRWCDYLDTLAQSETVVSLGAKNG